jgi:hypothetical protein
MSSEFSMQHVSMSAECVAEQAVAEATETRQERRAKKHVKTDKGRVNKSGQQASQGVLDVAPNLRFNAEILSYYQTTCRRCLAEQKHHLESKITKAHNINKQWPNILVQVRGQDTTENKVPPYREISTGSLWSDRTLQLNGELLRVL